MKHTQKLLAMVLSFVLLFLSVYPSGLAQEAPPTAPASTVPTAEVTLNSLLGEAAASGLAAQDSTWAQAAKIVSGLLGLLPEDAADVDLRLYKEQVTDLSTGDDSLYLGLLAAEGYLPQREAPIVPSDPIPGEDFHQLLALVFPGVISSQAQADALTVEDAPINLALQGDSLRLSTMRAGRLVLGDAEQVLLSGVQADAVTVLGTASTELKGAILGRVTLSGTGAETLLHADADTMLSELIITGGGDVVLEGDAAFGLVRVLGDVGSLSLRATCAVSNETGEPLAVTGPDGEQEVIPPGTIADFVLEHYLVRFVTEGTPVPSQMLPPGQTLSLEQIATTLEGKAFTAWYQDAEYRTPITSLTPVDRTLTLYARFVTEEEAATVTFETGGGLPVAPLTFAPGESLLCKPLSALYTSREGYSFSGWCFDEALEQPFGYSDVITGDMTLYALFVELEPEVIEEESTAAELPDLDWQGEIPLTVPEGATLEDLPALFTLEPGVGAETPILSFRESNGGFVAYGAYHMDEEGKKGFEPGSTFTLIAPEEGGFADFDPQVRSLVVSIFKEQVEVVEFAEHLTYMHWDQVLEYTPVISYEGVAEEGENTPGTVVLEGAHTLTAGQILVLYDGEINDDEAPIASWESGSFDGYVLFAEIVTAAPEGGNTRFSFQYANPKDYLSALDVHTTREVDLEGILDVEQMALIERGIATQVMANEEIQAQMLVAAMTDPATQQQLDDRYGLGVYQLASVSANLGSPEVGVQLSVSGNTITAGVSISVNISLMEGSETLLNVTPSLSFKEMVTVDASIDAGWVWVDAAVSLTTTTTLGLSINVNSGEDDDLTPILAAAETLKEIMTPEGITDDPGPDGRSQIDKVNVLMDTLENLVGTELPYQDLFVQNIFKYKLTFKGIVTFIMELDLVGQIGVLATFGVEIKVVHSERIGFNYNFLAFRGGSRKEGSDTSATATVYLVGKMGVRLGLRLTLTFSLCSIANASIKGEVFAYGELTGMYCMVVDLFTKEKADVGALKVELGIDANIALRLYVDFKLFTIGKSWTVWKDRWPLYEWGLATHLAIMDEEKLEQMWASAIDKADYKESFGFPYVPMRTFSALNGGRVENQLLWQNAGQDGTLTLELENLVVDGNPVTDPADPKYNLFYVGDGTGNKLRGRVYVDELVAALEDCKHAEADLVLTYNDPSPTALVKKHTRVFHLSRKFTISSTMVNLKIVLGDWCGSSWGMARADWDGTVLYENTHIFSHALGAKYNPMGTFPEAIQLDALMEQARALSPELAEMELGWLPRPRNDVPTSPVQYERLGGTSAYNYLDPSSGLVHCQIYPNTTQYDLTFYLYGFRFTGNGEIEYQVELLNAEPDTDYQFSIEGNVISGNTPFQRDLESGRWVLQTERRFFTGADQALLVSAGGAEPIRTGLAVNGAEPEEVVLLQVNTAECKLQIETGQGITDYSVLSPEIGESGLVKPGTQVTLQVTPEEGKRPAEPTSSIRGLSFERAGEEISFTMPFSDLSLTLTGTTAFQMDYQYNYENMGRYMLDYADPESPTAPPEPPLIPGLTFRGWYLDAACSGEPFAFGAPLTQDLVLYADWTCDVTLEFAEGEGFASYQDEEQNTVFLLPEATDPLPGYTYSTQRPGEPLLPVDPPTRERHRFTGWYTDPGIQGEPLDTASFLLTGGITLYAGWVEVYTINLDLGYQPDTSDAQSLLVGDDPADGSAMADANAMVTAGEGMEGDATSLYGILYIIAGQKPQPEEIPADPVRSGYRFTGWRNGEDEEVKLHNFLPERDQTLTAQWEIETYKIEYMLTERDILSPEAPTSYTVEAGGLSIPDPTRFGYTFLGWDGTELAAYTKELALPPRATGDRQYTAHWEPTEYTITLNPHLGTLPGASATIRYTIESETIPLPIPSRSDHIFQGWVLTAEEGTEADAPVVHTEVPAGTVGNRTYTAKWLPENDVAALLGAILEALEADTGFVFTYVIGTDGYAMGNISREDTTLLERDIRERLTIPIELQTNASLSNVGIDLAPPSIVFENDSGAYRQTNYELTLSYSENEGTVKSDPVTITVLEKKPDLAQFVTATPVRYGESLEKSIIEGEMRIAGTETPVEGTFRWVDKDTIPKSKDNGTAMYEVQFIPADKETYPYARFPIAVQTQVGLEVRLSVEDKAYDGTVAANGTLTLSAIDDPKAILENITLKTDSILYDSANVGTDKTVTANFSVEMPDTLKELYALQTISPITTTADIEKAQLTVVEAPKVTVMYDSTLTPELLQDVKVVNAAKEEIPGAWIWTSPLSENHSVDKPETLKAQFTPEDDTNYAALACEVAVEITARRLSPPVLESLMYNGEDQRGNLQSILPENLQGICSVALADSTGKPLDTPLIAPGEFHVLVTLTNPNYLWDGGEEGSGALRLTARIEPLILTYSGSGNYSSLRLPYGLVLSNDASLKNGVTVEKAFGLPLPTYADGTAVRGEFQWDSPWYTLVNGEKIYLRNTVGQVHAVQEKPYPYLIEFIPNDANIASFEIPVDVYVVKVAPDLSGIKVHGSMLAGSGGDLSSAYIYTEPAGALPVHPVTRETIPGTWTWEEPKRIPDDPAITGTNAPLAIALPPAVGPIDMNEPAATAAPTNAGNIGTGSGTEPIVVTIGTPKPVTTPEPLIAPVPTPVVYPDSQMAMFVPDDTNNFESVSWPTEPFEFHDKVLVQVVGRIDGINPLQAYTPVEFKNNMDIYLAYVTAYRFMDATGTENVASVSLDKVVCTIKRKTQTGEVVTMVSTMTCYNAAGGLTRGDETDISDFGSKCKLSFDKQASLATLKIELYPEWLNAKKSKLFKATGVQSPPIFYPVSDVLLEIYFKTETTTLDGQPATVQVRE